MRATLLDTTPDVTALLTCACAHVGIPFRAVGTLSALYQATQRAAEDDFLILDLSLDRSEDRALCREVVMRVAVEIHIMCPDGAFVRNLEQVAAGPLAWLPPDVGWPALLQTLRALRLKRLRARARTVHRDLSDRQKEVLALVVRGRSQTAIAHMLGVTAGTIKSHVARIEGKLGVSSTEELKLVFPWLTDL